VLETVTSSLLIFAAVRRDCHPADNTWAKTFYHLLHWRGGLHLLQLLQQRTHGSNHHGAGPTLRAAPTADPHRDLQERLLPVERPAVAQRHCHQVGAATQPNLHTLVRAGGRTTRARIAAGLWQPCSSFPGLVVITCVACLPSGKCLQATVDFLLSRILRRMKAERMSRCEWR